MSPRALRKPVELQGVGGIGNASAQRADHGSTGSARPSAGSAARRPEPRRPRLLERGVVDILADVVFVEPHRAVRRQRKVLCVRQIHTLRRRTGVLEANMPEPGRRVPGEHKRDRVVDTAPRADTHYAAAGCIDLKASAAQRSEQRRPFDRFGVTAQVQIRGATLEYSLPTKSISEIGSQSNRRSEPLALICARSPEGLLRHIGIGSFVRRSCRSYPRADAALRIDSASGAYRVHRSYRPVHLNASDSASATVRRGSRR